MAGFLASTTRVYSSTCEYILDTHTLYTFYGRVIIDTRTRTARSDSVLVLERVGVQKYIMSTRTLTFGLYSIIIL